MCLRNRVAVSVNLSYSTAMLITLQVGLSYAWAVASCCQIRKQRKDNKNSARRHHPPAGLINSGPNYVRLFAAHRSTTQEWSHLLLRLLSARPRAPLFRLSLRARLSRLLRLLWSLDGDREQDDIRDRRGKVSRIQEQFKIRAFIPASAFAYLSLVLCDAHLMGAGSVA
jgi:hypothetical protein